MSATYVADTNTLYVERPAEEPLFDTQLEMESPARFKILDLPGLRKSAILLIFLGDDLAGEVLKHLNEDEVQAISRELATVNRVAPDVIESVVREFYEIHGSQSHVPGGGPEYAKRLLMKSLAPEKAKRMVERLNRSLEDIVGFDALGKISPQQLSKLLQNEHPQTVALVLAHLDSAMAAETLGAIPDNRRADLIMRLANLQTVSQDVVRRVAALMEQKLRNIVTVNQRSVGGIRSVADLCNRLDRDSMRKMLEEIETKDSKLAVSIRDLMITFEDVLSVDDVGVREVLKMVDRRKLALALKGSNPEIEARFYKNMSARAAEMLRDEMELMGAVKMKDVSEAQREIVAILRELDEKGVITLNGGDGYVG
jgi:flagellar motor switch protein FliG